MPAVSMLSGFRLNGAGSSYKVTMYRPNRGMVGGQLIVDPADGLSSSLLFDV